MAHIDHVRNIRHLSGMSVGKTLRTPHNFAAFCGSRSVRDLLALQAISRFCGDMGVVLLHNDPLFEARLGQIYTLRPSLTTHPTFEMILANRADGQGGIDAFYDPLYGLSDIEVLDVLLPAPAPGADPETGRLRALLSDYLKILALQFARNRAPFGDHPYNLDLLLDLVGMPFYVLEDRVLRHLPESFRRDVSGRLSAENACQTAYQAVLAFSQAMETFLWKYRGFAAHTRTSLIRAVENRQLISLYVPVPRDDVLDYLCAELQHLNRARKPYLLVENGLHIASTTQFKQLFLSEHGEGSYYTGILSEDTSGIVSANNAEPELAALFGQTREMYVFACPNALAAKPFSDALGSYYRQVTEHHTDLHRQPFHLFGSRGYGYVTREVPQKIVTPEELMNLGEGCLLCGKNYPTPVLIDRFTC